MNLVVKPIEELGVETHNNYKFEHEDQDCIHQDNQDSIDKNYTFEQENQDSTHQDNHDSIDKDSTFDQEDENNPLNKVFASLNIIIHQETLMKIILQDTSNDDQFLYMYRSSRLHDNKTHLSYSKLRKHFCIDARRIFFDHIFL
jgi:hypothetical protein